MKNSGPLHRKTPLKRTPFNGVAKRNANIRRISAKKRKEIAETGGVRKAFLEEMCVCCLCGEKPTDVHETWGGSVRTITVRDRRFWLPVCRKHHDKLQGMPKVTQMVLKAIVDPTHYDRDCLKEIKGGEVLSEVDVIRAAFRFGSKVYIDLCEGR